MTKNGLGWKSIFAVGCSYRWHCRWSVAIDHRENAAVYSEWMWQGLLISRLCVYVVITKMHLYVKILPHVNFNLSEQKSL